MGTYLNPGNRQFFRALNSSHLRRQDWTLVPGTMNAVNRARPKGWNKIKGKHGDGSKRTIPVFSLYFVQNPNPGLTLLTYQSAGRLAGKSNFPSTSSFL